MSCERRFDVLIIGGGPAGCTAALRLLAMGYTVGLVEEKSFPRPQIGEALSPGVDSILKFLRADHLLVHPSYRRGLSAEVAWSSRLPTEMPTAHRGAGVVVDRSRLDADLLQLAVARGVHVYQPARLQCLRETTEELCGTVKLDRGSEPIIATILLDARGHKAMRSQDRIPVAPSTIALWSDLVTKSLGDQTRIEAVEEGWIWGSPLPDGRFRVMVFIDLDTLREASPAGRFQTILRQGRQFSTCTLHSPMGSVLTRLASACVHGAPVGEHVFRLGEAAFAIDPLSSSGVETAMRTALQAAIAVNTWLQTGNRDLASDWYAGQLVESIVRHLRWTREHYTQSWPDSDRPFWNARRCPFPIRSSAGTGFVDRFKVRLAAPQEIQPPPEEAIQIHQALPRLWNRRVRLSANVWLQTATCVVGDLLYRRPALRLPHLPRPIAYLDEVDIVPLLQSIRDGQRFGEVIQDWKRQLSFERAARLALVLHRWNVIDDSA